MHRGISWHNMSAWFGILYVYRLSTGNCVCCLFLFVGFSLGFGKQTWKVISFDEWVRRVFKKYDDDMWSIPRLVYQVAYDSSADQLLRLLIWHGSRSTKRSHRPRLAFVDVGPWALENQHIEHPRNSKPSWSPFTQFVYMFMYMINHDEPYPHSIPFLTHMNHQYDFLHPINKNI